MRISIVMATAALALVFAATVSARDAGVDQANESTVQEATAGFYTALNAMFAGDGEPMKEVWSHAEDVTFMGPDGSVNVGWNEVLANWEVQTKLKLGGEIRCELIMATVGEDLAVVQCREVGENVIDGKPIAVSLRATNVFRKENGAWKMIGHQTDKLPFLQK
jgi:ketosteroid isomerase-like protein